MAKVPFNGNRKKEKGVTLIETVVSLAVIVVVSVIAVSISVYTSNIQKSVEIERYFTVLIENSLSLYQGYENEAFETAFNDLTGQTISYGNDHTYFVSRDYMFVTEEYSLYSVKYDFTENGLTVRSMYDDGEIICEGSTKR